MSSIAMIPSIGPENNLSQYLRAINKFPILSAEEERHLGISWQEQGNLKAAHKLVTSHLRLVAKIAMGYRGYGLPLPDLISEGNIGMMQAVKKFDPKKGFRLATYATWWIKAAIQEYVLHSWSMVKIGTTAAQKKLFFNLRKMKNRMQKMEKGELSPDQVTEVAERLDVSEKDVMEMDSRMAGSDYSLNTPINRENSQGEWQDWLVDETDNQEILFADREESFRYRRLLKESLKTLNPREQDILEARRLSEPPLTLQELSERYDISRERVRQIESRAFMKVQKHIKNLLQQEERKMIE